jgi:UDP-glucose 4-epimerase
VNLKDKRCLVTGGAGFIGSTITEQLAAEGAHVYIIDDLSGGKLSNLAEVVKTGKAQFIAGDIRDSRLLARLMPGMDYVFHEAAIKILRTVSEPVLAMDVIAQGTYKVAEAAAQHGAKLIAASSASVYGLAEEFPTGERHHPWNNDTLYGAGKAFTEGICRSLRATQGLKYVMLRYFNVYGPRMDSKGFYTEVMPRWMELIDSGKPPTIDGDGSNSRDFIHVSDIARGNLLAAVSGVTEGAYNLGSGVEVTLSDLAKALTRIMGSDLEPVYGPPRKADPVPRRMADISRATADFGWTPQVDFETGLAQLVSWWRTEGRK